MLEQFEMFKKSLESEQNKPYQPTDEELNFAAGEKLVPRGADKKAHEKWKADMKKLFDDPFMFDKPPTGKSGEQIKIFPGKDKK